MTLAEKLGHAISMILTRLSGRFSICRLDAAAPVPPWATRGSFYSITRTAGELSVVCEAAAVPADIRAECGWRVFAVQGPLSFDSIGILAELSGRLAAAVVSIFAVSTYDTDYLLVRDADVDRAAAALREAGHSVIGETNN